MMLFLGLGSCDSDPNWSIFKKAELPAPSEVLSMDEIKARVIERENKEVPLFIQAHHKVIHSVVIDSLVITNYKSPYTGYLSTTWDFDELQESTSYSDRGKYERKTKRVLVEVNICNDEEGLRWSSRWEEAFRQVKDNVSAQVGFSSGNLYDTIYATIEYENTLMRLVTIVYKDTLKWNETLKVYSYPVVRNQRIEVYRNGKLKHWHYIKSPSKYAYTTNGKFIKYKSIPVLGMSVQKDGDMFFFMADGCENGCGIVGEFLGIYSMRGETMFEGHGIGGVPITVDWRKKFGYVAPTTEIDYAFSQRYTLKDVSISSFFINP